MSKVYSFGYTKETGEHNNYVVLEKENNRDYFKGLDLLDGGQFKTFKAGRFDNYRCLLNVDDSQLTDYQVLSLDELCKKVNFHPGHVNFVGVAPFLNAANGTLAGGKKAIQLTPDKYLLYGSEVRQAHIYYDNYLNEKIVLNIGPDGTPLTASLNGKLLSNTELYNWINKGEMYRK